MQGVDIGRRLMLPDIDLLLSRGFGFVARYYDDTQGQNPKVLTTVEVAMLLGRRLAIVPVFETTGRGPWDAATGQTHGSAALAEGTRCGQPLGTPIWFAIDEDADPPTLLDYFNGMFIGLQSRYVIGVYGDAHVVKYARENWPAVGAFWQTYAWSAGVVYPAADLYQHANGVTLTDGLVVDLDFAAVPPPWRIA